ncbi:MAG: MBL fold metallo-hydrolase [Gammaproteobacteria bacterium]|nr:MBL fold metallo-hydrolase [Gammaproteobacteria bacterium]MCF6364020.1 MBL fold metallo-hydrolase [Gammaproteobacteria bacterium]
MRFASLGSGSRGNAMLVEHAATCVLVDCGFSVRETERRLARLGRSGDELNAIVVTHEHGDHINGVGALARKYGLAVWATAGTLALDRLGKVAEVHCFNSHQAFALDDLQVQPFPVPHDAREPCQFVFGDGERRLGILTDVGCATAHITEQLSGCDALMLECNHEKILLDNGNYPPSLKRRVAGSQGHLSNAQAETLLRGLETGRLKQVVAAHLSEKHNTPELARAALAAALGCESDWVAVADQDAGLDWREV